MLVLASGCRRQGAEQPDREMVYRAESVLTVRIVNHSQVDAVIYLVHDGTRDRLGTVTAVTSASFRVRSQVLGGGDFVLLADPIGSRRTASTEQLFASQGVLFTWTLETDFRRGAVLVQE
jgi:hypothetical protein